MAQNLSNLSVKELMLLYRQIGNELIGRDVTRTRNSPTGDIAEYLFKTAFGWDLEANSKTGYDALSSVYGRVQIKSRFLTQHNTSRQAGDIRQLDQKKFDWLGAVVFSKDAEIELGLMIPHEAVNARALTISHTNSSRIYLREDWLKFDGVFSVTDELRTSWEKINVCPIQN